jgi:hypothetical protein
VSNVVSFLTLIVAVGLYIKYRKNKCQLIDDL